MKHELEFMKLKSILAVVAFCMLVLHGMAQTKAVTQDGEEVILYSDGTWKYLQNQESNNKIDTNTVVFTKSKDATFPIRSKRMDLNLYINPKTFSFKSGSANKFAEFEIQSKNIDIYAMLITERIEVPLMSLKEMAIKNAKSAASDAKVVLAEMRLVNGRYLLCMEITGTIQGIKFHYYNYYYSHPGGTVQLITYTSDNIFEKMKPEMGKLLNGLVIPMPQSDSK